MEKASPHHQLVCRSIQTLKKNHANKMIRASVYNTLLSVKEHGLLTGLVGGKCVVTCIMNDAPVTVLSDTAAKVPLLDSNFLHTNFSYVQV